MILRHPRTPSQVSIPIASLRGHGHGTITGLSELVAAPCVDGTGFDTCRHLGCRRAFGRSGSEIASPSIAWDSSRRSGIPRSGQDCYCVRGLQTHSDSASRRLLPAALVSLGRDGTPDPGGVLRSLARDPIQVSGY